MVCLDCGEAQAASEPERCRACGAAFHHVAGVHGVNHLSQLLDAIDAYREGHIELATLKQRFSAFEARWDTFMDSWDIAERSISEALGIDETLGAVYGPLLERLEESLEHLANALDILETLDSRDPEALEKLEEETGQFWRGSCSALAGLFQKLDTRDGDVDSLLSAFFSGV